ncbi:trace amine-associated receptor 1-like [Epinephelus moara]|uniref:trace amine-associated receptor 1-like n=1 Tax=Epinephelus moara TaxID=300413 RepID=UPI00214E409B|nr:trace amine-associated receptor 1-like [Epinephelus moara]
MPEVLCLVGLVVTPRSAPCQLQVPAGSCYQGVTSPSSSGGSPLKVPSPKSSGVLSPSVLLLGPCGVSSSGSGGMPEVLYLSACVLLYIFLGLLSVVTVCGNLLVIISIIYFKQLHTPTNSLILSLAVADLLVGVVVFPLSMAFSLSSCLYYEHLFYRYYAVCQPLTYRTKLNGRVVVVMILVSWSASASVTISLMVHDLHQERCKENCFLHVLLINTFGIISSFYGPVIIVLSIYLKIFLVAQRQAHSIRNTTYFESCDSVISTV